MDGRITSDRNLWYVVVVVVVIFSICRAGCILDCTTVSVLYFIKAQQCQQQLIKPEYLNLLYEWNFNPGSDDMLIKFPNHLIQNHTVN